MKKVKIMCLKLSIFLSEEERQEAIKKYKQETLSNAEKLAKYKARNKADV